MENTKRLFRVDFMAKVEGQAVIEASSSEEAKDLVLEGKGDFTRWEKLARDGTITVPEGGIREIKIKPQHGQKGS